MGFRETYGGLVEAALNEAIDKNLDGAAIKEQLHKAVDKLVDDKLEVIKLELKKIVDKIDGEVG